MDEKANLVNIFGSALFGVTEDLVKAKEKGQELPGLLDKIATVAKNAKDKGIDLLKYEAEDRMKKLLPWIIAAVAVGILLVVMYKKS